ncbi:MAG: hypothetical protein IKR19_08855 [Acholeplasmatales bacterium]|nr:hypothetical protein [Acholeplasmatales bacterium]
MDENEKIYLIYCLLKDVRLDWSKNTNKRVKLARKLCLELNRDDFLPLVHVCDYYLQHEEDGRYFRQEFPVGYENMDKLHGLTGTKLSDRSEIFKSYIKTYILHPDMLFEDYMPLPTIRDININMTNDIIYTLKNIQEKIHTHMLLDDYSTDVELKGLVLSEHELEILEKLIQGKITDLEKG